MNVRNSSGTSVVSVSQMAYRELRELAGSGYSIFHNEASLSASASFFGKEQNHLMYQIVGIAANSGFSTLFMDKYLMNLEIGFRRRLLLILEEEEIPFEHMPSGIDNLSVLIQSKYITREKEVRIIKRVKEELDVDSVRLQSGYSLIVIVGEGIRQSVGLAARVALAVSRTNTSIQMINQGSSQVSLVFGINTADETKVLNELANEFFQKR